MDKVADHRGEIRKKCNYVGKTSMCARNTNVILLYKIYFSSTLEL